MFKRIIGYIKTLFRVKTEAAMDPEIEIEQAIQEARKQDQALRNQAAKVIAHRTTIEQMVEKAADDVGEARETAKQALLRAEQAKAAGDTDAVLKWTNAAQSLAMKLQASESNLESFKQQYEIAVAQAEEAKQAVEQNAMRTQELAAKRIELLGKLQQAKMQETVNAAVESMSATMEIDTPSLSKIEDKIQGRVAEASAKAELRGATPEGAEAELREAVSLARADDKLAELRAELGLDAATDTSGELPA
jgi:phage shock protein A